MGKKHQHSHTFAAYEVGYQTVYGTDHADTIVANPYANDYILAFRGNDSIGEMAPRDGEEATDDFFFGGNGDDTISSRSGSDYLSGGAGDDFLLVDVSANTRATMIEVIGNKGNDKALISGFTSAAMRVSDGDGGIIVHEGLNTVHIDSTVERWGIL